MDLVPDTLLRPGLTLGRYLLEQEIGRGTMGVVYRAFDPALDRRVALKTVQPLLAQGSAERASFERRFQAEARLAASLSHPAIVVVHDVGRDEPTGALFIAFELLPGQTLAESSAERGAWPWREALALVQQVARGLQHAHERGVVHRDIKPANVMVLPTGAPKIMDFGIAKLERAHLTSPGEAFGTPLYMSPEQVLGEPLDARSDVFSLGAVAYLLLTGRRAFDAPHVPGILQRVTQAEPTPPSRLAAVPADCDALLAHALAKSREARLPSAKAFADAIGALLREPQAARVEPWLAPDAGLATATASPPATSAATEREAPTLDLRTADSPLEALLEGPAAAAPAVPAPATLPLPPASAPADTPAPRAGRRALLAFGAGLALLALLALAWLWQAQRSGAGAQAPLPMLGLPLPAPPPPAPARIDVQLEHPLRSGTLRVRVDGTTVFEQSLESRVTRRVLFVKKRRGNLTGSLEVAPGARTFEVVVVSGNDSWTRTLSAELAPGEARRLFVRLEDRLIGAHDLRAAWMDVRASPSPEP
jgi:serine/threonine-protein kinase